MRGMDRPIFRPTGLERALLLAPALVGGAIGLTMFLAPAAAAAGFALPGNDHHIYRLAGAAAIGYATALLLGIAAGDWVDLRMPVLGTLAFSVAIILALAIEIVAGTAASMTYAMLPAAVAFALISGVLLYAQSEVAGHGPDAAGWVIYFVGIATAVSLILGLLLLAFPVDFVRLFALQGTDALAYRLAGAGALGYGVLGIFEIRSRIWNEIRLSVVMAAVFNGLVFLASAVAVYAGEGVLAYAIAPVSLALTAAAVTALLRHGS